MDAVEWPPALQNIETKCFPENRTQGLMICGLEWGGCPDKLSVRETPGFFSEVGINDYPYRSRLLEWFTLFGHRLETDPLKVGSFEKSIVQTNWLPTKHKSMEGRDRFRECVSGWNNFAVYMQALQPRLVLFLSVTLLEALNAPACVSDVEQILGKGQKPVIGPLKDNHQLKPFRVGFQEFERASVIALPHPTGSHGLNSSYLAAFKDEVGGRIRDYKVARGFAT